MMVAEYSKRTLGFLVHEVDRIIRVDWDKVRAPESVVPAAAHYITAITELADGGWCPSSMSSRSWPTPSANRLSARSSRWPVANYAMNVFLRRRLGGGAQEDRRSAGQARGQSQACAERHGGLGPPAPAWRPMRQQTGSSLHDEIDLILVDAEMPEMDGYVLTRNIKSDKRFAGIPVVMHSSLSSEANRAMGKSVGSMPMWRSSMPKRWPTRCVPLLKHTQA
jgi:two-component system chemotaxis response regulator CheV